MLSKIIENVARLLDDRQTLQKLDSSEEDIESDQSIQTYKALTNFVISSIAETYLCYSCTDTLSSNSHGQLSLADLKEHPCSIKRVYDCSKRPVRYFVGFDTIDVPAANKIYYVEYQYIPADLENLSDTVLLPFGIDYKAICYGVVSEYYALKMQFTEANIWEQKFKDKLRILGKRYGDVKFAARRL